jgi:hypothetical protein
LPIQVNALSLGVDFAPVQFVVDLGFLGKLTYDGFCTDSSMTNFPSFDIVATNIDTADDCVTECPTDNEYFNGFTFALGPISIDIGDFTGNICLCHFSGTTPEDLLYNNADQVGEINHILPNLAVPTDKAPEGYCYNYLVSSFKSFFLSSECHIVVNSRTSFFVAIRPN